MGGMNEFGVSCFADGWKAAGGKEADLTAALMKGFDLDEQTAKWHASRAFHPETASKENMNMPNGQAGSSEGSGNAEETDHFYSKENQEWLRRSIRQMEEGHAVTHDLIEVDDEDDDELTQRTGDLESLVDKLRAVKDWYLDFESGVISYARKKPERTANVLTYLISHPEAATSDIVEFISNQPDFYEDAAYPDKQNERKKCYLIAKRVSEPGCLAVQMEGGAALAGLVEYLGLRMLDRGVEILTVSDMNMFGEYKPYHLVGTEKEFICKVLDM